MVMEQPWDAIVIGSGMGGLTCAALLAKVGERRVLVLEKHDKMGGLTHELRHGPYSFDVGLHYVGGMAEGEPARRIMDTITEKAVRWVPLPDPFEVFVYPGFRFAVPFGEAAFRGALQARFSGQVAQIDHYFRDIERAASWLTMLIARKGMPHWLDTIVDLVTPDREELALGTTGQYLRQHFDDPLLIALLASQWGDYGLPPGESPFCLHALVVQSYFSGAHYPAGGGHVISEAVEQVIRHHHGEIRVGQEVTEIMVQDNRALGVKVRHGHGRLEEIRAPLVVSDAGADTTYLDLLPSRVELWFRDEIRNFRQGRSGIILFVGLREDPRRLGLGGENYWIYTGTDHDAMARDNVEALEGRPKFAMVSFASLRDPTAAHHTAQIITEIDAAGFAQWSQAHPSAGGAAHEQTKAVIREGLLDLVEAHLSGFRELIDLVEVATPWSMNNFTGKRHGAFYGLPAVPEKLRRRWLDVETPVTNLLLTGSDVGSMGIGGASMGGVMTAGKILGARVLGKVMRSG